MAKESPQNNLRFEQAVERLEEIIRQTDSSGTELEDVISLVEEGKKLIKHCKDILKKAELRIETLESSSEDDSDSTTDKEDNKPDGQSAFSFN